jgi:pimeloyl-ACP methyl ester carboxylesterase
LEVFSVSDALADGDAVTAELGQGPPIVVGHSLGGYVGLRYAATRRFAAWIGLDGPFAVVYPWEQDDPALPESILQIGREIRAINVVEDFAAMNCPAMLMLSFVAADPMEECLLPARRAIAEHIARHHSAVRIEWVPTGHDALLFHNLEETVVHIRDFLQSFLTQHDAEPNAARNGGVR